MKIVLAGAVAALALAGATLMSTAPAQAFVHFGITLHEGDVRFAYRDGYWDRWHRWHAWDGRDDWRWWRAHHPDAYYDWAHDRDPDMGWRVAGGPVGGGMMMGGPGVVVGVPAFEVGESDILYAYHDGYWDRWHHWHAWHGEAERIWWRDHHPHMYCDWHHDRDHDMGWHVVGTSGGMMMGGPGVVVGVPGFEVSVGDIRYAYADGYWDRWHHWHAWHNDAERIWWRDHHPHMYADWHHDRDHDMGWHHDWH